MPNSVKENSVKTKISEDLQKAKTEGQLRTERIREIVKLAVSQAVSEIKEGSVEIRSIVREAVSTVIDNLQDRGQETKEEITASIEGAIEGISSVRRQAIAKTQSEVEQLQAQIDGEEKALQGQIDSALMDIEETGSSRSTEIKSAINSAVSSVKDSEEVSSMRKRYAQLQTQLSVLQANLAARYGARYEEVQRHLDSAKTWYDQTKAQAEVGETPRLNQKQVEFEQKMGEAGAALARGEQRVKQLLKELWHSVRNGDAS
ncbi:histidine kinase [Oculatella sp. FACHB-28]|uniref:histidine kinase n=1 Tax=Cyanophyceae TaxID=3028117 RepID=UPI0016826199|nr:MULTISPECIES: histidine kinase [Cyanophyceae]MBD2001393.1 histidine kinase [Leptolyngbya sp. FACHB-541]MBD2058762.1 histidine kinase [Oculatella sp. FACHB-28]